MKTKLFFLLIVVMAMSITIAVGNRSNKKVMYNIALSNIESMAADEAGTPIKRCGKRLVPSKDDAYHYICPPSTTAGMIYKCPNNMTMGDINEFEGRFYCKLRQ